MSSIKFIFQAPLINNNSICQQEMILFFCGHQLWTVSFDCAFQFLGSGLEEIILNLEIRDPQPLLLHHLSVWTVGNLTSVDLSVLVR